jgi:hypothetical protein
VLVALTTLVIPVLAEDNFRNNVSANGFYIQDTGSTKNDELGSFQWSDYSVRIEVSTFKFNIYDRKNSLDEDIAELKSQSIYQVPVSSCYYFKIKNMTINGYPAVVGAIDKDGTHADLRGFIYVKDRKVEFEYTGRQLDENFGGYVKLPSTEATFDQLVGNIKITDNSNSNMLAPSEGQRENASISGLYVDVLGPMDYFYRHEKRSKIETGNIEMEFTLANSATVENSKAKLMEMLGQEIPDAIFNITETSLSGFPAIVGTRNQTSLLASGEISGPDIRTAAIAFVSNQKVTVKVTQLIHPAKNETKMLKELNDVRITLAPGAEMYW